ncbi:hypothetical protein [Xenorhabdus bharatensis]|uniref:hypothetical protein n=1 Tax=Xenorhabdus bharatensis TaxID=3136256 RepID=UPI0030F3C739
MKYFKFFSEGFSLFEDVPYNATDEYRLTISGHGSLDGGIEILDQPSNFIGPEKLISILNNYFGNDIFKYRHIRLLFCYSADNKSWYSGSFAGNFSRLLPDPKRFIVEAYEGTIGLAMTACYERDETLSFEEISRFNRTNYREENPKMILASDYDTSDVNNLLFRSSKITHHKINQLKNAFWNSVDEIEDTFDSCEPLRLIDIVASRIYFCNGKSSKNINDFR